MTPREILTTKFNERKARNQAYSLRAYASSLGVSAGMMSQILAGKRALSRRLAQRIVKALPLSNAEREAMLSAAVVPQAGRSWGLPEGRFVELSPEEFHEISQWYYFAVLGLGAVVPNRDDPAWIAKRLGISEQLASATLRHLLDLGIVARTTTGGFVQISKPIATRASDTPNFDVRRCNRQVIDLARQALDEKPLAERDFSVVTLTTTKERIPEAKALLKRFRREFMALMENGERQDVYFLAMQLFEAHGAEGEKHEQHELQ